ncbi:hypothetical protein DM860_013262 [Cuscuta australis]|uniref:Serpin domain-containing protein n=1 Tax=Cuscuta australis TaxID=267555 RepID=A0A328DNN3_9ASTE|nr:hypothetical protein DM860_013262 [Cuscuta australis]
MNKANEVVNHINLWVKSHTGGLIKQILNPNAVDNGTLFILANALYFKGDWAEKFDAKETKRRDFYLLDGSSIKVPFMSSWKGQCVRAFDGFKVLRLSYEQGNDETRRFSMYIFLPDAEDGLPSLVHKVTSEPGLLERCLTSLPNHPVPVGEFRIPKFKSSFHLEFSNILKGLGVASPFDGGEGLAEMVDGGYPLHVTNVIHKSFIEVNEQGTEAAAVTVARMGCGALRPRPRPVLVDFVADHPFLYFIREDLRGAIVLLGTLINPLH